MAWDLGKRFSVECGLYHVIWPEDLLNGVSGEAKWLGCQLAGCIALSLSVLSIKLFSDLRITKAAEWYGRVLQRWQGRLGG
jgi:hypothetical protein